ncbi:MAG: rhomboid family intramembrane serine protease [Rhodothermales bacterium]
MYQNSYRPTTRFSFFPPVIKNLLILNGLIYMAQLVQANNGFLTQWFALWPFSTPFVNVPDFWPWQLLTYGFLHSTQGIGHLFFNMFALWMFGIQLENHWGSRRFGLYYIICVMGAGLVQLIVSTQAAYAGTVYPTIGASGGVFGILLAFGMMFPNQVIVLIFPPIPIKAKWLVIGYGVLELFAGVSGMQPGVANFAHLGGMLFGFLLIMYWRGKLPIQPKRRM